MEVESEGPEQEDGDKEAEGGQRLHGASLLAFGNDAERRIDSGCFGLRGDAYATGYKRGAVDVRS